MPSQRYTTQKPFSLLSTLSSFTCTNTNKNCVISGICHRSSLFWDLRSVDSYRRFGSTYRSHLQGSNSLGLIDLEGCPETSVTNSQSTPRNIPKQRRSHLQKLQTQISVPQHPRVVNTEHLFHLQQAGFRSGVMT